MSDGYPSDWDTRRKKVYKRDEYTCQNCGKSSTKNNSTVLHAHHVIPKSRGGGHQLSNLQTLCESCHQDVHGKIRSVTDDSAITQFLNQLQDVLSGGRRTETAARSRINPVSPSKTLIEKLNSPSNPFNLCPLCEQDKLVRYDRDGSSEYDNLKGVNTVGCQNCYADFTSVTNGWELYHAPREWKYLEGYQLSSNQWNELDELRPEVLARYQAESEDIGMRAGKHLMMILIGSFILAPIFILITGFAAGAFLLTVTMFSGFAIWHRRYI
jgi:5-methylcytosine-specific restriction endonuclease McrA